MAIELGELRECSARESLRLWIPALALGLPLALLLKTRTELSGNYGRGRGGGGVDGNKLDNVYKN